MYSVAVRDYFMITHSLRGDVFGPAQRLHGATYDVEVELRREELSADGIVVDIGRAGAALRRIIADFDYRNLDEDPVFRGVNTTTERLAREILERMRRRIADGELGPGAEGLAGLRVRLRESPSAWAAYEAALP